MSKIDEIKASNSIFKIAERLGLNPKSKNGTTAIKCPSPSHEDKHPSCVLMNDINKFKCKSCGVKGDIFDLVQLVKGYNLKEAMEWIKPEITKNKIVYPLAQTPDEYIKNRKITPETIKKFDIRVLTDKIVYPVKTGYKQRLFGKKDKWTQTKGAANCIFKTMPAAAEVIFCEGEIDAIKLWQETKLPVWTGTAGAESFEESWKTEFSQFKRIYLALDNDKTGNEAAQKIAKILGEKRCFLLKVPEYVGKDWNDYFKWGHTGKDFIKLKNQAELIENQYSIIDWKQLSKLKFPKEEWWIDRFLVQNGFTLIVGEQGSGKSFLSLDIAKSLIESTTFLNKFKCYGKPKMLFIDKENGLRRIQKRLTGMNCKLTNRLLFLKHPEKFTLDDKSFIDYLTEYIKKNKIDIIIIDSLIDILLGNENDSGDTAKFFNSLRKISLSVSWLILHHSNKPAIIFGSGKKSVSQRTRGSSNIIAQVDNQFYLEKDFKNPKLFTIAQGKSRDFEPLPKMEIEFISSEDKKDVKEIRYLGEFKDAIAKAADAKENVLEIIKQRNGLTKKEIYQIVLETQKVSFCIVNRQIISLEKDGIIESKNKPKMYYFTPEEKT